MGSSGGSYEHGNEHSGSLKGREFLDRLSDYQLLRRTLLHGVGCLVNFFTLCTAKFSEALFGNRSYYMCWLVGPIAYNWDGHTMTNEGKIRNIWRETRSNANIKSYMQCGQRIPNA